MEHSSSIDPPPASNDAFLPLSRILLDSTQIERMIRRMAHEIIEKNQGATGLYLIGILKGGGILAERLADLISTIEGDSIPLGTVDITLYRDDLSSKRSPPFLRESALPESVDAKRVVLVDDVLFTGRSVRSAMDLLMDLGRPARVQLAVLIDRGHRELPIRADFVGKNLPTSQDETVQVSLESGHEHVVLHRKG
ncbi:MAG: bifunctional pyr operon transcriptional regulator/uracil phosphoribosyltransferase PyrR [Leptospirales bacterium]